MLFRDEGARKSTEGRTGKVWGTIFSKWGYPGHGLPPSGLWFPVLTSVHQSSSPLNSWVPFQILDFSTPPRLHTRAQLSSMPELFSPSFSVTNSYSAQNSSSNPSEIVPSLLGKDSWSVPLCSHLFCVSLLYNAKALLHWFHNFLFPKLPIWLDKEDVGHIYNEILLSH